MLRRARAPAGAGRDIWERGLPGPLQGREQGRAGLWRLARGPVEQPIPPEQDQPRCQDANQEQRGKAAAPEARLAAAAREGTAAQQRRYGRGWLRRPVRGVLRSGRPGRG